MMKTRLNISMAFEIGLGERGKHPITPDINTAMQTDRKEVNFIKCEG